MVLLKVECTGVHDDKNIIKKFDEKKKTNFVKAMIDWIERASLEHLD